MEETLKDLEVAIKDYNDLLDAYLHINTDPRYWSIWGNDWDNEYYDYDLDQDFRWRCRIQ